MLNDQQLAKGGVNVKRYDTFTPAQKSAAQARAVARLQAAKKGGGASPTGVPRTLDTKDVGAVRKFQYANHLPVTGRVDGATHHAMRMQNIFPGGAPLTAPLSATGADAETRRATEAQFLPVQRQMEAGQRIEAQRAANIPVWFQQYNQQLKGIQGSTQQGYKQARDYVATQASSTAQNDNQARTQLLSAAQKSAQQRGLTVDPSTGGTSVQASTARQAAQNGFGGLLATFGANTNAYQGNQQAIAGRQGLQARLDEGAVQRVLLQKMEDLSRQKADYASTYRANLRDSERKYALENKAFGLNVATANQKAAQAQADLTQRASDNAANRQSRSDIAAANRANARAVARIGAQAKQKMTPSQRADFIAKNGVSPERLLKMSPAQQQALYRRNHPHGKGGGKPTSGPGSLPPGSSSKLYGQISYVTSIFRKYKGKLSGSQIRAGLQDGSLTGHPGVDKNGKPKLVYGSPVKDGDIINAAEDIVYLGGLSPANIRALHARGLRVGRYGTAHRPPAVPPVGFL